MTALLTYVFWLNVGFVVYVYLGYPLFVWLISRFVSQSKPAGNFQPSLTLIIPAYNEERWIRRKIENALELEYPREQLQIVVASDGSTDRTVEIAQEFSTAGVEVKAFPQRIGKQEMLNRLAPQAQSEILVMTDANALLPRDALRLLIPHFADPQVGCVSGNRACILQEGIVHGAGEGLYWRYESWIKKSESRMHSCLGAQGQLYAVRREVFPHVEKVGEDFYIPMKILAATNLHVKYEAQAVALIPAAASLAVEFERKTRAHVSFLLTIPMLKELLRLRHPVWWQYISHHLSRMAVPVAMFAAFASSLSLAGNSSFFQNVVVAQLIFYVLAGIGYVFAKFGKRPKFFYVPFYFVFANLAIAQALLRWPFRKYDYAWKRTERLPVS